MVSIDAQVCDRDGVLSEEEQNGINQKLAQLEKDTQGAGQVVLF